MSRSEGSRIPGEDGVPSLVVLHPSRLCLFANPSQPVWTTSTRVTASSIASKRTTQVVR